MGAMTSRISASLGEYETTLEAALQESQERSVIERIWEGDYTVWRPEPDEIANRLNWLRSPEDDRLQLATTVGYGARFLHFTGQLHKGDAGNGLFVQLTADHLQDALIPDEADTDAASLTFDVMEEAQALGDRQALLDAGRRVIRLHLGEDVVGGIERLLEGSS